MLNLLLPLALLQAAPATPPAPPKPSDALPGDWMTIPDDEIMVIALADGRRVTVRLASRFVPAHRANIAALIAARWWDGESIYRVQENWVAQWGDASEKKPMPAGVGPSTAPEFEIAATTPMAARMSRADAYSTASGFTADGWPIATDGKATWLTHCYGSVGVARDSAPDSGSGSELFTPIGQSARRLDRNYAVVGRIIDGMSAMSSLPRSDAPMGVYATPAERTKIVSVRLASELPAAERPHYQYRRTDNPRFAAYIASRERPDAPTVAIGATVCDLATGVRKAVVE
ncbi:MAG: peptidylprolyl isomerase [Pseudomonadota bacterium]